MFLDTRAKDRADWRSMRTQTTVWFHHTDLETPMSAIPITVTGTIATEPSARTLPSGRACASFRLAVNHWRVDKNTGEFVPDGTSWFGVDCYGDLASNSAMSLNTGAAVIVSGSLRNREWTTEERSGISPTVVAEHIGPDLRYGTAHYKRAKAADRSQSTAGETTSESSNRMIRSGTPWAPQKRRRSPNPTATPIRRASTPMPKMIRSRRRPQKPRRPSDRENSLQSWRIDAPRSS